MKIFVRGISDEFVKEYLKVIIRAFCECESVYARADFSRKGNLKGVKIYPTGSKALIGYVSYHVVSGKPTSYAVINRRQVVKTYALKEGGEE
mgnify:CR=1 FL=1|jgi:hypothetical protein